MALLLCALLLAPALAGAHAMLEGASPGVGSTVDSSPGRVVLSFTQRLEPSFSTVEVTDGSGRRVDRGNVSVRGASMSVGLRPLGAGRYRVRWRVLSVDSHRTQGSFSFRVAR